jgi:hypothetical protein
MKMNWPFFLPLFRIIMLSSMNKKIKDETGVQPKCKYSLF